MLKALLRNEVPQVARTGREAQGDNARTRPNVAGRTVTRPRTGPGTRTRTDPMPVAKGTTTNAMAAEIRTGDGDKDRTRTRTRTTTASLTGPKEKEGTRSLGFQRETA